MIIEVVKRVVAESGSGGAYGQKQRQMDTLQKKTAYEAPGYARIKLYLQGEIYQVVIQVVKRVVAESGSEGAYIKNCVKWIVCSGNSIGEP